MELGVLGRLEVAVEGRALALRSRNERIVLSALASGGGEVVSTDRLIDALWGDRPPRSAAKTLQNYVLRLRKLLGHDAIETMDTGYRLGRAVDSIDVVRFSQLAESGRAAAELGAPERASSVLREALSLWRGEPFEELQGWPEVVAEVSRLDELRRVVTEDLIDAELACGRHVLAVVELERMVVAEPLRERRWCQLMTAQYRCGRQSDALATYQRARHLLIDELGIEPGPQLREVEQAVIAQDPRLDVPGLDRVGARRGGVAVAFVGRLTPAKDDCSPGSGDDGGARLVAMAAGVAAAHHGSDPGVQGDEVTVWFASPLDCLEAALELRHLAADRDGRDDTACVAADLRVGVHAGEPDWAAGEPTGTVDAIARSLCGAAEPGQILVSELVRQLVEGRTGFIFDEVGAVDHDGHGDPVQATELVGEVADRAERDRAADHAPFQRSCRVRAGRSGSLLRPRGGRGRARRAVAGRALPGCRRRVWERQVVDRARRHRRLARRVSRPAERF